MPTKGRHCHCTGPINETTGRCVFKCEPKNPKPGSPRRPVGVRAKRETLLKAGSTSLGLAKVDKIYAHHRKKAQERYATRRSRRAAATTGR